MRDNSRYPGSTRVRYHTKKVKKDSRTIPLHGDGEDTGKWYRCWNCGFICNEDRDDLGGSEDRDGNSYKVVVSDPYRVGVNTAVLRSITNTFVVVNTAIQYKNMYYPVSNSGCPFCGCRNWRGDY